MSATALELRHIARRFGNVVALADAELVVRRGTVHALLGENGAGKTTLMRIAFGMLSPHAGELLVNDERREFGSPASAIAAGIGMVQQHPTNVGAMTVWENVILGGSGVVVPRSARREVDDLASQLGFSLDAMSRVDELSVAAQQRLEILKAVNRKARLLILDEPTAILAPDEARELYAWLRKFALNGGTAVVVTHKLEEARAHTDELTVLRAGRTVLQKKSETVSSAELTEAMIGEAMTFSKERSVAAAGAPVLRAKDLTLADARGVSVIREATFDVRAGEILGVAGVEGSGHHELLLAMAGRLSAQIGRLDLASATAIVPEDRHRDAVVLSFSLAENAAIKNSGERRGLLRWSRVGKSVEGLMAQFDVRAPGPETEMRTLSGGNQQKFVLARELSSDPRLVIAENPTRGLDVRASAFVRDQLRKARGRGAAIVFYSSDLDEIIDLADRVIVVQAGKVAEVQLDRARIGAAMLGAA